MVTTEVKLSYRLEQHTPVQVVVAQDNGRLGRVDALSPKVPS